jgi:hypothetical protein
MEPERSLLCSQEPSTGPYPDRKVAPNMQALWLNSQITNLCKGIRKAKTYTYIVQRILSEVVLGNTQKPLSKLDCTVNYIIP